jgi:hypothetical protein
MKMSEEFPSKYIKASDLNGREVRVIMQHCEREEVGTKDGRPDYKPVLYIKGKDKPIVLNKTNAQVISDFYGDDTADWFDQPVYLYAVDTEYQGKKTQGLRIRIPTAKDNKPSARPDPISSGPAPTRQAAPADMDDDIPF